MDKPNAATNSNVQKVNPPTVAIVSESRSAKKAKAKPQLVKNVTSNTPVTKNIDQSSSSSSSSSVATTASIVQEVNPTIVANMSDSESNSADSNAESVAKKAKRTRDFRSQWIETFDWIECRNDFAFCKVCDIRLTNIISHLVRHDASPTHKKQLAMSKITPITELFQNPSKVAFERQIKQAELTLVMFCLMHHLPFRLMDFLPNLLKMCCPDSKIAKNIKCGRTKASEIVKNILGPKGRENVADQLKTENFSIIIDETTDISTAKSLALVARVFDKKRGQTRDRFLGILKMTKADAATIFTTIINHLNLLEIPVKNIIGLASDNASVMSGQFSGVQARFKQIIPNLVFINCICHSLHLCASNACQKLPFTVEQLARNIYNFFAHSSKRCTDLQEFQEYFSLKPHKILGLAQTRWLSLEMVINRILEQWDALQMSFISCTLEDKGAQKTAKSLAEQLSNPINKIYFLFLSYSLNIINRMNVEFQSEKIRIHIMNDTMETNFKLILSNFIKPNCFLTDNINDIDFTNEENHLPLAEISMGYAVQSFISLNRLQEDEFLVLTNNIKQFYIKLAEQIKLRFNFNDPVINHLKLINPVNLLSSNMSSITALINLFPNLVENEKEKDDILDEVKILKFSPHLVQSNTDQTNIEEFWCKIGSVRNSIGSPLFGKLAKFMYSLMSLPHSSAAAERIFSNLNNIKNKLINRLLINNIDSMMAAQELISDNEKKSISSNKISEVWVPRLEQNLI